MTGACAPGEHAASELARLSQIKDEVIDLSDIPEVADWRKAAVGRFYRPIKEPLTARLSTPPRGTQCGGHGPKLHSKLPR